MNIKLNGSMMINDDILEFDNLDVEIDETPINYEEIIYDQYSEYDYFDDDDEDYYDEDNCEECSNYINAEDFYNSYATLLTVAKADKEYVIEILKSMINEFRGY